MSTSVKTDAANILLLRETLDLLQGRVNALEKALAAARAEIEDMKEVPGDLGRFRIWYPETSSTKETRC